MTYIEFSQFLACIRFYFVIKSFLLVYTVSLKEWVSPAPSVLRMKMSVMSVKNKVYEMLKPLEEEGYEIWNVEYAREGKDWQLRVFVDIEGGIDIDGCEAVSRFLEEKLDKDDSLTEAYSLVVSSPGMDRVLIKDEHFTRYAGQPVEVALYKAYEGRKKFTALLGKRDADALYVTPVDRITLEPEGGELCIPSDLVSKVNLAVVF